MKVKSADHTSRHESTKKEIICKDHHQKKKKKSHKTKKTQTKQNNPKQFTLMHIAALM